MKRTKMMIVTLAATVTVALSLVTTAFAAPATASTSTCPKTQALQQLPSNSGSTLPTSVAGATTSTCPKAQALQQLLSNYGSSLPTNIAGTTNTCSKTQALQQLLSKYGITLPTAGTATLTPTTSPAPTTGSTTGSTTPVNGNMSADESKMINLVNQDRASNGLKALTFDSSLRAGALAHSQDMKNNNYFSHTSPTLGDFTTRIRAAGISYSSAGENIALYGSVDQAEVGFMNSPGHRANILGDFTRIGIGIIYNQSKGQYYITQWFAK